MSSIEVVSIGLATADTIVSLPGWPEPDGRVVADRIVRSGGGPAATAAVALARLGHTACVVAAVGEDEVGRTTRRGLQDEGIDVSHIRASAGNSPESVILLDRSADTRSILHAPGARLDGLDEAAITACSAARWIHVDQAGYRLTERLDRERLSIDAGHRIENLALDGIGLYAPSASGLRDRYPDRTLGAAVAAALADGAARVVVTLGAGGVVAAEGSGTWRVAGMRVKVVSTLGAGDVFHGALLASLLEGLSLGDAARRANVAAALSCRALDGRQAIPTREELDAALDEAPPVEPVVLEELAWA